MHSGLRKKRKKMLLNLEGIALLCVIIVLDYDHLWSQVLGLFVLSVTKEDVIWCKAL